MDIIAFENAIRGWATAETTSPVIFLYPSEERPTTQYVGLNVFQIGDLGFEDIGDVSSPGNLANRTFSVPKKVAVSVNTYYAGAFQLAVLLADSLKKIQTTEYLREFNIGLTRVTQPRKLPEKIALKWEERAQFDIMFFARSTYVEEFEAVLKVEVNGVTHP